MGAFRIAQQLLRGGGVSGTTPDDTYQSAWIVDGSPGTPYQKTGNVALAVTPPASASMDVFALINHTVNVSTVLSGAVSGSIPAGVLDEEGIRYNPFLRLTPANVSTAINLAISSNSGPVIVGEFFGGLSVAFEAYQLDFDPGDPFEWEGEFSSIAPYDPGLSHPRRLSGEVVVDDTVFAQIQSCYRSTLRGSRPALIIPDDAVQDAWMGVFRYRERYSETLHFVTLEVMELPRTRW